MEAGTGGKAQSRGASGITTVCGGASLGQASRSSLYRPGERGWVKIKNRDYWRYAIERESAIHMKRVRQFV